MRKQNKTFLALAMSLSMVAQAFVAMPAFAAPEDMHEIKYCGPAEMAGVTNPNPNQYKEKDGYTFQPATKNGFEFVRWYTGKGEQKQTITSIPKGSNKKYDGVCPEFKKIVVSHNITYVLNDGVLPETAPVSFKEDETVVLPTPARMGYNFAGWFTTADFEAETEISEINKGTKTDVTVYAKWTAETYNIQYLEKKGPAGKEFEEIKGSNNAEVNASKYTYGVDQEISSVVVKKNKDGKVTEVLLAWYTDEDMTEEFDGTIVAGTYGPVILYAKFGKVHDIKYILPEGATNSENNPTSYVEGGDVVTFEDATLVAHTFDNWYVGPERDKRAIESTAGAKGKLDLTALFTPIIYTVTIEDDNDTEPSTIEYTIKSEDLTFEVPAREGYAFKGYIVTAADEDSSFKIGDVVTGLTTGESYGNITITAQWEVVETPAEEPGVPKTPNTGAFTAAESAAVATSGASMIAAMSVISVLGFAVLESKRK